MVGEAPGQQEIAAGTPFTGKSGQLMNKILQHNGIDRKEVYVTNATLCRPPGNATPPAAAVRSCRPRLVQEVLSRDPKRILTLGNVASQSLLQTKTGITALRSELGLTATLDGTKIPVTATFHPAAALRVPDHLPSIVADVKKITRAQVTWEPTNWEVARDIETGIKWLRGQLEYGQGETRTLDIEIDVDNLRRIDAKNPNFLCIGVSHKPGATIVYDKAVADHGEWRALLNKGFSGSLIWGMQNGKFDIQYLWGGGVENARVDEDTMLAHYATDERKGTHDLEQLAVEILGAPKYKQDAKQYLPRKGASLAYLPEKVLFEYNAGDCDVTHRLLEPLHKEMESDGTTGVYRQLLIPGSNALARAEYVGTKVDGGRLDELHASLSGQLQELEEVLHRWVGNPRSPQQVRKSLGELGFDVAGTNKEILKGLDHEFPRLLLRHRATGKLLSTYVIGLRKSLVRSRIHPTFLLHGTETGRLSCRRPNLQNIPSGPLIRDVFTCGPENVLLSADYNQIEFRLAGILSGDEWLITQFREGRQFHKEVARNLFGDSWSDLQYLRAKAVNFGTLYGRQAWSLAQEHGGSVKEWQKVIDDWFGRMPKVKEYQKELETQIRERGYLDSYFGRKRRFWLVTSDNWHNIVKEGYNFPLQSTASDLTLYSLIRLEPLLRGKAAPVITVHDSLVFEVKRQYLEEVAVLVKSVMEDTPVASICPTPIDMKVGRRWGDHKDRECPDRVCEHLKEYNVAA
jgi:uracil-DNA glycosylase family 4